MTNICIGGGGGGSGGVSVKWLTIAFLKVSKLKKWFINVIRLDELNKQT